MLDSRSSRGALAELSERKVDMLQHLATGCQAGVQGRGAGVWGASATGRIVRLRFSRASNTLERTSDLLVVERALGAAEECSTRGDEVEGWVPCRLACTAIPD